MKENPSPGPSTQHVFSPKRPVAAFLVMTAALSFALLFASGGQTYAASSASASKYSASDSPHLAAVTPTPTPPPLSVTITSPSNGSVYIFPAQIPFTAAIGNVIGSVPNSFTIDYYATLEPNGLTTLVGQVTETSPRNFTVTWVPPQAGLYSLVVKAEFVDEAGVQDGTSAPIAVQINAPQISPTPAFGSCKVSYHLESQWSGGFNVNVVLTNTSSVPMNGWTLAFMFPGDQKITELWNGSSTQTGEQASITNLSYNGTIMPGGTVNLGFNGAWISNDSSPTAFTLNGHSCGTT